MKLGCFGFSYQIESIARAGYDTVELDAGELAAFDEAEFLAFCNRARLSGLSFEVFSGLLPLHLRILNADFDRKYWLAHIQKVCERAAALGGKIIPFGAGKCRSIPPDCTDVQGAKEKILSFIRDAAQILSRYNLMLAIEPLGPANSNFLNYIEEAVWAVKSITLPNCKTMCDLRHMHKLHEDMGEIVRFREEIIHAHIDYPEGDKRLFPSVNDGFDYAPYLDALRKAQYQGILTIEATDYEDFGLGLKEGMDLLQMVKKPQAIL